MRISARALRHAFARSRHASGPGTRDIRSGGKGTSVLCMCGFTAHHVEFRTGGYRLHVSHAPPLIMNSINESLRDSSLTVSLLCGTMLDSECSLPYS